MLLFVLIATVTVPQLEVELGHGSNPRVAVTADGTRLLIDATGDAEAMAATLSKIEGASIEKITAKRIWASITTPQTFTQARSRGSVVSATLGSRDAYLIERLRERTPELGSVAAIPQIKSADTAIARGKLDEAKVLLADVKEDVPGYVWAQLRSGDLAMLQSDRKNGCAIYGKLGGASHERTASMIATIRAHGFDCTDAPALDWNTTLRRTRGLDSGVSVWMAYEIIAAAGSTSARDDLDALLPLARNTAIWPHETRSAMADLSARLVARSVTIRLGDRMSLASFVRGHSGDLGRHVDGKDLRLDAARSLLDLDLVDDAIGMCGTLLERTMPGADAPFRTWRILADAYIARRDDDALKRLTAAFESRYHESLMTPAKVAETTKHPMLMALIALEQRVKRLKSHISGGSQ